MDPNAEPAAAAAGSDASPPRQDVVLTDPRAIRALAHPARLKVIDELFFTQVERTATELAVLCGLTPSAMSYHLRALEKWQVLTRGAARPDGRERPWRAAGRNLTLDNTSSGQPPSRAQDQLVAAVALDGIWDRYQAWANHRRAHPDQPPDHANLSHGLLWLTNEESRQLQHDIAGLIDRAAAGRAADQHPPDAHRAAISWSLFPDVTST